MNYYRVDRGTYLRGDYVGYDYPQKPTEYIYCEICDNPVAFGDAAPDGLCIDCYTDKLIDEIYDRNLREYICLNRSDFTDYLRGAEYDC